MESDQQAAFDDLFGDLNSQSENERNLPNVTSVSR